MGTGISVLLHRKDDVHVMWMNASWIEWTTTIPVSGDSRAIGARQPRLRQPGAMTPPRGGARIRRRRPTPGERAAVPTGYAPGRGAPARGQRDSGPPAP